MHPAASIEIRTQNRLRARVHVEQHATLPELTTVTFSDGNGTALELSLSPDNLGRLIDQLAARKAQVAEFAAQVAQSRSAVKSA